MSLGVGALRSYREVGKGGVIVFALGKFLLGRRWGQARSGSWEGIGWCGGRSGGVWVELAVLPSVGGGPIGEAILGGRRGRCAM